MIAGGLEDPSEVISQGLALVSKSKPYVELTQDGRKWLTEHWPKLESEAKTIFQEVMSRIGDNN